MEKCILCKNVDRRPAVEQIYEVIAFGARSDVRITDIVLENDKFFEILYDVHIDEESLKRQQTISNWPRQSLKECDKFMFNGPLGLITVYRNKRHEVLKNE